MVDFRHPLTYLGKPVGVADAIKLDDLAEPDDNIDLNASIAKHGLLPKLVNVANQFLNGVGNWVQVTWEDISGKPTSFLPSAHTHPGGDISSQVADANTVRGYHPELFDTEAQPGVIPVSDDYGSVDGYITRPTNMVWGNMNFANGKKYQIGNLQSERIVCEIKLTKSINGTSARSHVVFEVGAGWPLPTCNLLSAGHNHADFYIDQIVVWYGNTSGVPQIGFSIHGTQTNVETLIYVSDGFLPLEHTLPRDVTDSMPYPDFILMDCSGAIGINADMVDGKHVTDLSLINTQTVLNLETATDTEYFVGTLLPGYTIFELDMLSGTNRCICLFQVSWVGGDVMPRVALLDQSFSMSFNGLKSIQVYYSSQGLTDAAVTVQFMQSVTYDSIVLRSYHGTTVFHGMVVTSQEEMSAANMDAYRPYTVYAGSSGAGIDANTLAGKRATSNWAGSPKGIIPLTDSFYGKIDGFITRPSKNWSNSQDNFGVESSLLGATPYIFGFFSEGRNLIEVRLADGFNHFGWAVLQVIRSGDGAPKLNLVGAQFDADAPTITKFHVWARNGSDGFFIVGFEVAGDWPYVYTDFYVIGNGINTEFTAATPFIGSGYDGQGYTDYAIDVISSGPDADTLDGQHATDFVTQETFDDHSTRHENGGADSIKLDDLAAPDANTDLNATNTKHGLFPMLSGVADQFINGLGNWITLTPEIEQPLLLGPDLTVNSNFDINLDGWTISNPSGWSLVDGKLTGTPPGYKTSQFIYQNIPVTLGKQYCLEVEVVSGEAYITVNNEYMYFSTPGINRYIFNAEHADCFVQWDSSWIGPATLSRLALREVSEEIIDIVNTTRIVSNLYGKRALLIGKKGPFDFNTIKEACDYISTQSPPPSYIDPWYLFIKPDTYYEEPFTVPSGTFICNLDYFTNNGLLWNNVVIKPVVTFTTGNWMTLQTDAALIGLYIQTLAKTVTGNVNLIYNPNGTLILSNTEVYLYSYSGDYEICALRSKSITIDNNSRISVYGNAQTHALYVCVSTVNFTQKGGQIWAGRTGGNCATYGLYVASGSATLTDVVLDGYLDPNIVILKNAGAGNVQINDCSNNATLEGTIKKLSPRYRNRPYLSASLSNPPTSAELTSVANGTPATLGAGYSFVILDTNAPNPIYQVISDGTNWQYVLLTVAI